MKTVHTVKTKLNKDDKNPVTTVLTIDWVGTTAEMLQVPATDTLVINWQGQKRRSKKIPLQEEFKAAEMIARMGSRSQGTPTKESAMAQLATLSKEDRDAIIAQLAAEEKLRNAQAKQKPPAKKGDGDKSATA